MTTPLEKYLAGYLQPIDWQAADVKGDPQMSALLVALATNLSRLSENALVWDLGMGSGLLAPRLADLPEFRRGKQVYCGVDLVVSGTSVSVSGVDTGLLSSQRARYYSFTDFLAAGSLGTQDCLVVLRNVLHEIDLVTLARLGWLLATAEPERLIVLLQDLSSLAKAELGSATWATEAAVAFFTFLGFEMDFNVTDESRSSTPWFTLSCTRRARREVDVRTVLAKLIEIRKQQAGALKQFGMTLLGSADRGDDAKLSLLKIQNDLFAMEAQLVRAERELSVLDSLAICGRTDGLVRVSWDEICVALDKFSSDPWARGANLVVGIARGGLPIAVALAHRLENAHLGAVFKRYADADPRPFFVFDKGKYTRSERERLLDGLVLPNLQERIARILLVDDVTTFGNTFAGAENIIRTALGRSVEINFFTFACDRQRLAASKPEISRRLTTYWEIDNMKEWLLFPWEPTPISGSGVGSRSSG